MNDKYVQIIKDNRKVCIEKLCNWTLNSLFESDYSHDENLKIILDCYEQTPFSMLSDEELLAEFSEDNYDVLDLIAQKQLNEKYALELINRVTTRFKNDYYDLT